MPEASNYNLGLLPPDHPALLVVLNPCRHRSPERIRYAESDCCGHKGKPFSVYACALYNECSPHKMNKHIRPCLFCADYSPNESPA